MTIKQRFQMLTLIKLFALQMHTCDTCQRRTFDDIGCAVLKEAIGKNKDCPFWTDDPDWEIKAEEAIKKYNRANEW